MKAWTSRANMNPGEVADVFEVPLNYLMNPANHRRHEFGDVMNFLFSS